MRSAGIDLRIAAVVVPWLAAIVIAAARRHARPVAFCAALCSVVATLFLLHGAPPRESLDEVVMVLFASLTAGATLMIPRRDCTPSTMAGVLMLLGSTLLAYGTDNLVVMLAAWVLTAVPFFVPAWFGSVGARSRLALAVSGAAFAAAVALISAGGNAMTLRALHGRSPGGVVVFTLLVIAVITRKGIWPAHAWIADAVEHGPAIPTILLLNGHLGAFLAAKVIMPAFPFAYHDSFALLTYLALGTALYTAVRALAENSPRTMLGLIGLSQSACILAGLESQTTEGITGALVHWCVVTVSTTGLFGIVRLLEVRFGENLTARTHMGLAENAPRLAVFFLVFGLALVGLPGTLSFCSQDLLIHGTLAAHKRVGLLLPIATASTDGPIGEMRTRNGTVRSK